MTIHRRRDLDFGARRGQIVARFVATLRVPEPDIQDWISRWERLAEETGVRRDSLTYWNAGLRWIAQQREQQAWPVGVR